MAKFVNLKNIYKIEYDTSVFYSGYSIDDFTGAGVYYGSSMTEDFFCEDSSSSFSIVFATFLFVCSLL